MRKLLLVLFCFAISIGQLTAQTKTVKGKLSDQNGNPIPNASVTIKGLKAGTTTDLDGNFTLAVPPSAKTLIFSSVNFASKEMNIADRTDFNIQLQPSANDLKEVVVTSLGITRDKRSLGYATQTIKGDAIANKGAVNVVSALQGKVSGVNITGASGSAGASVNINIRGITSFTGSNQPLFVIDGIPISNDVDRTNGGPNGTLGDNQPSNRALDIDPNSIESINILKGPAASVLYGSRAAAGAVIITTKKGSSAKGKVELVLISSYSQQHVTGLQEVQNDYGEGLAGVYNPASTSSWGPKFGSTPTVANGLLVGGVPVDYRAYPHNINDFFENAPIRENSATVNGGDAMQNFTISIANLNQKGILPNTVLKRTNLRFGANTTIGKVKLGGTITFTNTVNSGVLGGNGASALGTLAGFTRSIDLTSYKVNGTYKNPDGSNNFPIAGVENPYFGAFENPIKSNLYRFTGSVTAGYDITSWLNIGYRLGIDVYTDRRKQIFAVTAVRVPTGQVLENTIYRGEINGDLLLTAKKSDFIIKDLNISGLLGQNVNQRSFQNVQAQGDNLAFPGFYNISNATVFTNGSIESNTLRRILGYYAQASFDYKSYLFLELTGRADQSSTLPKLNNTYFYPAVSAGFIFTDALNINSDVLNYGKIRASVAKVGRDADPYLLSNVYVSSSLGNNVASFNFPLGSTAGFGASTRVAPVLPLKPEFTTSYEAGLNVGLFNSRISVDLTYFNAVSKSQIINVGLAPSTGFATKTTNTGRMTNKGVEVLINGGIISSKDVNWDLSFNYTRIVNKVTDIAPGITSFSIPGSAFTGSVPSIKIDYPFGVILGGLIPRSPSNERIINPTTGLYNPVIANQVLADPNPNYSFGFTNNIRYKAISLNFTFDFTKGGQLLSFTTAIYKSRGVLKETAVDREQPRILPGVIQVGDKFVPNNIQIPAQSYWTALGGLQSEFNVYDATVFRFREISAGFDFPADVIKRLKLKIVRFSIFAQNIFYVAPNAPFDPSVNTQGAGNIRGLDLQGAPNARTIGVNLKLSI
ncbi:MAG: SusC/RagA family TonB-linked outer membrane protein [Chitinophagaceae bacterium]